MGSRLSRLKRAATQSNPTACPNKGQRLRQNTTAGFSELIAGENALLGMKLYTLNRILVGIVISAVAAAGMSTPTNAQQQQQDQQDKQKKEKKQKAQPPAKAAALAKHTSRHIAGRILNRRTRQGIPALRVEAWDKDLILDDVVASAITDALGSFRIEFDQSHFQELFLDREPDLFFKIFRGDELIKSTEDSVLWNIQAGETEIEIEVDVPPVAKAAAYIVRGQVRWSNGSPFVGGLVRALEKDLRHEQLLGEARTDESGRYEIQYSPERARAERIAGIELIVRVFDPLHKRTIALAESPVRFRAKASETVDLVVGGTAGAPPNND
jgi:hypothetical protein